MRWESEREGEERSFVPRKVSLCNKEEMRSCRRSSLPTYASVARSNALLSGVYGCTVSMAPAQNASWWGGHHISKRLVQTEATIAKKRKVVLACGYLGTEFDGLQRNPGHHSVEEVLLKALQRSGLVHTQHDLRAVGYSASSRTDKGVYFIVYLFYFM